MVSGGNVVVAERAFFLDHLGVVAIDRLADFLAIQAELNDHVFRALGQADPQGVFSRGLHGGEAKSKLSGARGIRVPRKLDLVSPLETGERTHVAASDPARKSRDDFDAGNNLRMIIITVISVALRGRRKGVGIDAVAGEYQNTVQAYFVTGLVYFSMQPSKEVWKGSLSAMCQRSTD